MTISALLGLSGSRLLSLDRLLLIPARIHANDEKQHVRQKKSPLAVAFLLSA
ncbi:hypothetical protein ACI7RC_19310 [Brevibacillus sp. B_LB10_24]|uniref:hypothetical protein n=1 Tax=Brevibacillus sp. B_LB10_24 TaxID=3380645 RepID=UPI0038B8E87D